MIATDIPVYAGLVGGSFVFSWFAARKAAHAAVAAVGDQNKVNSEIIAKKVVDAAQEVAVFTAQQAADASSTAVNVLNGAALAVHRVEEHVITLGDRVGALERGLVAHQQSELSAAQFDTFCVGLAKSLAQRTKKAPPKKASPKRRKRA